jgi:thiol:disulfide interchange protein
MRPFAPLRLVLLLLAPLMLVPSTAHAQGEDRMEVSVTLDATEVAAGGTIKAKVKLDVKPGFHTYPVKQKDPKQEAFVTSFRVKNADTAPVSIEGEIKGPEPKEKIDPTLGTILEYDEPVELEVPIKVKPTTPAGKVTFSFSIRTQVCDEKGCLPYSKSFDLPITVTAGPVPPKNDVPNKDAAPVAIGPNNASTPAPSSSPTPKDDEETNFSFILTGLTFGWITLFTPCVFPMIPITVSFFLKQENEGKRAVVNASVYSITIVVAMTIIAFAFVGAFQTLTQRWPTNFILGALFIYFALSLFGMYEITLPSFLTRWTSAGEAKGGYVGTVFMALTFTIISFSCVAPFLGGFAGATASERPISRTLMGALAFALAFAMPFFILALFPTLLKRLPKSGNWLNSMKVVMGFLEIAAAIKFLRAAEILFTGGKPAFLTYDLALGMYITLCLLCGLYLIGLYQLPHDETDDRRVGVGRLLWSFVFLGLGFYLLPGLFGSAEAKNQPSGKIYAWVDAFLLPDKVADSMKWHGFLPPALNEAKQKKQRIFIDFTGVT